MGAELAKAKEELAKAQEAVLAVRIKAAQSNAPEDEFKPALSERRLYHVILDKPLYDKNTGKKLSKAYPQKFSAKEFNLFKNNSAGLGFTIKVVWDPELYYL